MFGISFARMFKGLLPGELIKAKECGVKVVLKNLDPSSSQNVMTCDLLFTSVRLIFQSGASKNPVILFLASLETITMEQILGRTNKDVVIQLELVCRDFQIATVLFSNAVAGRGIMALLLAHRSFSSRFPFEYFDACCREKGASVCRFGRYDSVQDFARMDLPNARFVLNDTVNMNFQCCPTYPQLLCVPAGLSDSILFKSAAFRTKRRFPVVVWQSVKNGGCLLRSSQPHVGVGRARSEEDELLIKMVSESSPASKLFLICDARPRINAIANQASASGGSENPAFYPSAVLVFGDIENIHNARSSYQKLQAVMTTKSEDLNDFEKRLRSSGWQKHLHTILACARSVSDWVLEGRSALVHCSDGWDRTPQVLSLCQLMLDPHYRTVEGFATLIEKDWVAYG